MMEACSTVLDSSKVNSLMNADCEKLQDELRGSDVNYESLQKHQLSTIRVCTAVHRFSTEGWFAIDKVQADVQYGKLETKLTPVDGWLVC